VAYDRAGFGRSGTGPADLTPREQIRQLHETLERLGTPPARIVVGTSYGGDAPVAERVAQARHELSCPDVFPGGP
jgi:pimeloyl-ACP methyl ester carboxylesterase